MLRLARLGLLLAFFALLMFMMAGPARADDQLFSSPDAHVIGSTITGTEATLGAYAGTIGADIDPVTGAITNGHSTITFGDGSTLSFDFEGQIYPDLTLDGTWTITGGSGALDGASGGGTFAGTTDLTTYDTDIEGILTLP
jgi:hypothetical protein